MTVFVAAGLMTTMSMSCVFRGVMEAMSPRRVNSAATKYSPATPISSEVALIWSLPAFLRHHHLGLRQKLRRVHAQLVASADDSGLVLFGQPQQHCFGLGEAIYLGPADRRQLPMDLALHAAGN